MRVQRVAVGCWLKRLPRQSQPPFTRIHLIANHCPSRPSRPTSILSTTLTDYTTTIDRSEHVLVLLHCCSVLIALSHAHRLVFN
jgi:hypothetical protein